MLCGSSAWPQMGLTAKNLEGSRMQFRHELNTYFWQWDVGKRIPVHPRLDLSFAGGFRSDMLKLSTDQKWKDDQSVTVDALYRVSAAWQLIAAAQSLSFMDRQTGLNTDIHTHSGQLGFHYRPSPRLEIKSTAGPKWDYRFDRRDYGLSYQLDGAAREWDLSSYRNTLTLALLEDRFRDRRNLNNAVGYQIAKAFAPGTADTLRFFGNRRRNDNYTSVFGDFESLREENKGLINRLGYRLADGVQMQVNSGLQFRDVEVASYGATGKQKSRHRSDQIAENGLSVFARGRGWHHLSQWTYQSLSQKYDLESGTVSLPFSQRTAFLTPNNNSRRLSMIEEGGLRLGRADSLFASGAMSLFRYDTPDTGNFDDRDEWRSHIQILYRHYCHPALQLEIESSVNLYHMVYLFGERSADNNWNRILRLRPGLHYQPHPRLRWHQSFEVLANYVDYDFEGGLTTTKSHVFRKFSMDDSLNWRFADHTSWSVDYRLQLEENGQLFWQSWSERVMTTRTSHWIQARLNHFSHAGVNLSPGFTVYIRKEWRHDQTETGAEIKKFTGTFFSYGPMLRIRYTPSAKVHVLVDGVRRRVQPEGQPFYYINDLDVQIECYF